MEALKVVYVFLLWVFILGWVGLIAGKSRSNPRSASHVILVGLVLLGILLLVDITYHF